MGYLENPQEQFVPPSPKIKQRKKKKNKWEEENEEEEENDEEEELLITGLVGLLVLMNASSPGGINMNTTQAVLS